MTKEQKNIVNKERFGIDELYSFPILRKHGFNMTLWVLNKVGGKMIESEFFKKLKNEESYLNEFFRVKQDLVSHNLIEYTLNEDNNKVINLTEYGHSVFNHIKSISSLLIEGKKNRVDKIKKR